MWSSKEREDSKVNCEQEDRSCSGEDFRRSQFGTWSGNKDFVFGHFNFKMPSIGIQ